MSPCISVTTEVVIDSHYTSTGHLQHCLRVPRLAVATAVLRLAPDIVDMGSRDELGLLLGFLGFEAALTMPALQSGSGRSSSPNLKLHCCRDLCLQSVISSLKAPMMNSACVNHLIRTNITANVLKITGQTAIPFMKPVRNISV